MGCIYFETPGSILVWYLFLKRYVRKNIDVSIRVFISSAHSPDWYFERKKERKKNHILSFIQSRIKDDLLPNILMNIWKRKLNCNSKCWIYFLF